jgi:putative intracellular protease/amidase
VSAVRPGCSPASVFLIAGGSRGSLAAILAAVFDRAGLVQPRVAYLGAANGDDPRFCLWHVQTIRSAGARRVVPVRVSRPGWQAALAACDAVFVAGGDVRAGMKALQRAGAVGRLRRLWGRGIPFIGVSAGSIMLARAWIEWPDPADDRHVRVFPCLGLAPVLCDTHDEPGWPELKHLLSTFSPGTRGVGLRTGSVAWSGAGRITLLTGTADLFRRDISGVSVRRVGRLGPGRFIWSGGGMCA